MALSTPLFFKPRVDRPPRRELTKEQLEEIKFAFVSLDYNQTGSVTQKQLKVALRALGFEVKKADVYELLRRHGDEDKDKLDYDTFKTLVADKLSERSPQDDLKRAFQLFDVHGLGKLDLAALRKVSKSLGMAITDDELHSMIQEYDLNHDGMIDEQEFMAIMTASDD